MISPEIKELLLSARPLNYLDSKELDRLIAYTKILNFSAGEPLQQQGKTSEGLYIIIKGTALVTARILGKETINLAILEPGDFIGEIIDRKYCTVSASANSQLECLLITHEYYEMLGIFFPEMKHKITKAITETVCTRLRSIRDQTLTIIKESTMTSRSTLKEIIYSLSRPKEITLAETHLTKDDLKKLEIFKLFSESEFENFMQTCKLIKINRNWELIKENDPTTPFYVILRGAVLLSETCNNKSAKLTVKGPLSIICGISNIDNKPAIFTYTTCEPSILLQISYDNLNKLHQENIKLWYKLYDLICKNIISLDEAANKLYLRLNSESYNREGYV